MQSPISEEWLRVDQNLHSLRRQLQISKTEEDFQTVGVLSRETVISIGQAVFDEALKAQLPNIGPTDAGRILSKYFEIRLPGRPNEELRGYSKASLRLALALQHMRNASYVEAELCTEASAHLVMLVRILHFEQTSPPNKRFRHYMSASAEGEFITSWLFAHFDSHPVAKSNGFSLKGVMFQGPEVVIQAARNNQHYVITLYKPYWWRDANRISADSLMDEVIVGLLTELDKEHFIRTGQPPA